MFIIGVLFFVFGFITWLGSVLIPYLRIACELNNFESYLVAFAFYISYFVMAVPQHGCFQKQDIKEESVLVCLLWLPEPSFSYQPLFYAIISSFSAVYSSREQVLPF